MAAEVALAAPGALARRRWLLAVVVLTLAPFALVVALAPAGSAAPSTALTWLLFAGTSSHVAATGWFYSVREVRRHMRANAGRYVWAPLALVVGLAALVPSLSDPQLSWLLLAFFAWQFFHFQKQNLGVAALAARACGAAALTPLERRAIVAAGLGGIAGLAGHPALLQTAHLPRSPWLFAGGLALCAGAVVVGLAAFARRPSRPAPFAIVYCAALLFFAPVFVFASPYAAVAGLTIAHGLQYLLLVGLLAGARGPGRSPLVALLVFLDVALLAGLALNAASHLHTGGPLARVVFGAYLGLVCTHFVVDAGLWRLRDEFPRAFLGARLPYLLGPRA